MKTKQTELETDQTATAIGDIMSNIMFIDFPLLTAEILIKIFSMEVDVEKYRDKSDEYRELIKKLLSPLFQQIEDIIGMNTVFLSHRELAHQMLAADKYRGYLKSKPKHFAKSLTEAFTKRLYVISKESHTRGFAEGKATNQ